MNTPTHVDDPESDAKLSPVGRKYFKFIEFDKDERLIAEIRKHPIGLFFIYFTGISIAIIITLLFGGLAFSDVLTTTLESGGIGSGSSFQAVIAFVGLIMLVGILGIMTIQAILYQNNVIYVTTDKVAQILYISLFNRKISQLGLNDIQDVTVTQKGILANMFNYGTLVIETAGEQQNYTFSFIPDPYHHSRLIVGAHEENRKLYGN